MNYLLFGGAPFTGKTSAINRLARLLISPAFGYKEVLGTGTIPLVPVAGAKEIDFRIILEGTTSSGMKIYILINSATDDKYNIDMLKELYDNNSVHVVISSVRDIYWERDYFFNTMNINLSDFVVEIPMAKITRRNDFALAVRWYENTIDNLAIHNLRNNPFNI